MNPVRRLRRLGGTPSFNLLQIQYNTKTSCYQLGQREGEPCISKTDARHKVEDWYKAEELTGNGEERAAAARAYCLEKHRRHQRQRSRQKTGADYAEG